MYTMYNTRISGRSGMCNFAIRKAHDTFANNDEWVNVKRVFLWFIAEKIHE